KKGKRDIYFIYSPHVFRYHFVDEVLPYLNEIITQARDKGQKIVFVLEINGPGIPVSELISSEFRKQLWKNPNSLRVTYDKGRSIINSDIKGRTFYRDPQGALRIMHTIDRQYRKEVQDFITLNPDIELIGEDMTFNIWIIRIKADSERYYALTLYNKGDLDGYNSSIQKAVYLFKEAYTQRDKELSSKIKEISQSNDVCIIVLRGYLHQRLHRYQQWDDGIDIHVRFFGPFNPLVVGPLHYVAFRLMNNSEGLTTEEKEYLSKEVIFQSVANRMIGEVSNLYDLSNKLSESSYVEPDIFKKVELITRQYYIPEVEGKEDRSKGGNSSSVKKDLSHNSTHLFNIKPTSEKKKSDFSADGVGLIKVMRRLFFNCKALMKAEEMDKEEIKQILDKYDISIQLGKTNEELLEHIIVRRGPPGVYSFNLPGIFNIFLLKRPTFKRLVFIQGGATEDEIIHEIIAAQGDIEHQEVCAIVDKNFSYNTFKLLVPSSYSGSNFASQEFTPRISYILPIFRGLREFLAILLARASSGVLPIYSWLEAVCSILFERAASIFFILKGGVLWISAQISRVKLLIYSSGTLWLSPLRRLSLLLRKIGVMVSSTILSLVRRTEKLGNKFTSILRRFVANVHTILVRWLKRIWELYLHLRQEILILTKQISSYYKYLAIAQFILTGLIAFIISRGFTTPGKFILGGMTSPWLVASLLAGVGVLLHNMVTRGSFVASQAHKRASGLTIFTTSKLKIILIIVTAVGLLLISGLNANALTADLGYVLEIGNSLRVGLEKLLLIGLEVFSISLTVKVIATRLLKRVVENKKGRELNSKDNNGYLWVNILRQFSPLIGGIITLFTLPISNVFGTALFVIFCITTAFMYFEELVRTKDNDLLWPIILSGLVTIIALINEEVLKVYTNSAFIQGHLNDFLTPIILLLSLPIIIKVIGDFIGGVKKGKLVSLKEVYYNLVTNRVWSIVSTIFVIIFCSVVFELANFLSIIRDWQDVKMYSYSGVLGLYLWVVGSYLGRINKRNSILSKLLDLIERIKNSVEGEDSSQYGRRGFNRVRKGFFGNLGEEDIKGIEGVINENKYEEIDEFKGVVPNISGIPVKFFVLTSQPANAPPVFIYERIENGVLEVYFSEKALIRFNELFNVREKSIALQAIAVHG
ncbi:MAG: hypothetical protein NC820_07440, partial [Candidatus Omnitrophica bacterium]|nr:hypothetical protein [Candidatus Omnitrophota bacterium]